MAIADRVLLSISNDEMSCDATILPAEQAATDLTYPEFIEHLNSHGVLYGIDESAVLENILLANAGRERTTFRAASAIPAVQGGSGTIEMNLSFPVEERRKMLTTEKSVLGGRRVLDGELLLTVTNDGLEGIDGTTVTGNPILSRKGQASRITPGRNIRVQQRGRSTLYYAAIAGIAHFENSQIIYVRTCTDGWFNILISEDRLRLVLSLYAPSGGGRCVKSDEIVANLVSQGFMPSEAKIREIRSLVARSIAENADIVDHQLLEGTAPLHGEDGRVHFEVNIVPVSLFTDKDGNRQDRIDYYNVMQINSVREGQLLAEKVPPSPAVKDGVDVFGKVLPARDGLPAQQFKAGKNIRVSPDGFRFFADIAGQVKYKNGLLWVSPVYVVRGDVDFSVGNVNFVGDVIIEGSILDNFQVKSDESIIVNQNVGAANVYAGGNLVVRGGIINKKKSAIIVQGSLMARFLENTAGVDVTGDILIEDYILQSEVLCRNIVYLSRKNKGQIIGGEILAEKGIDARTIGNENEVPTRVCVGPFVFLRRQIGELEDEILATQSKLDRVNQELMVSQTRIDKEGYKEGLRTKVTLTYNLEQLIKKKTWCYGQLGLRPECFIRVEKDIFPKTEMVLNDRKIGIKKRDCFRHYWYDTVSQEVVTGTFNRPGHPPFSAVL